MEVVYGDDEDASLGITLEDAYLIVAPSATAPHRYDIVMLDTDARTLRRAVPFCGLLEHLLPLIKE